MWRDPNYFKKRKPISLGGTPANKFTSILALSVVVIYAGTLEALSYTPYLQRKIKNVKESVIKANEDRDTKAFLSSYLVAGVIKRKQLEYEEDSNQLDF